MTLNANAPLLKLNAMNAYVGSGGMNMLIDEYGALVETRLAGKKTEVLGETRVPVPICSF